MLVCTDAKKYKEANYEPPSTQPAYARWRTRPMDCLHLPANMSKTPPPGATLLLC
jgi:hypothetical protein